MKDGRFGHGVVIGKFLPPHRGHRFLIESALSRCDRVTVIVCGKPVDPIPPDLRAAWLRELLPAAEVRLIDDRYDENDSRIWAENTIGWLGRAPDVVFMSPPCKAFSGLMSPKKAATSKYVAMARPADHWAKPPAGRTGSACSAAASSCWAG
jgi:cytidyltransferase-like protein